MTFMSFLREVRGWKNISGIDMLLFQAYKYQRLKSEASQVIIQRLVMAHSEPKPKIIYKNLQSLLKSSSAVKNKQPFQSSQKSNRLKTTGSIHTYFLKKSSSRHSLKSKEKIHFNDNGAETVKSMIVSGKKAGNETYCSQVDEIYEEMEAILKTSKILFLQRLRNNQLRTDSLQELEQFSVCMKQMFNFFTERVQKREEHNSNNRVLTEASLNNGEYLQKLSGQNAKMRKNSRLKGVGGSDSKRKPSVYQMVLMKKF